MTAASWLGQLGFINQRTSPPGRGCLGRSSGPPFGRRASSVAVRRSWGWWRCRWRGGFIRAGARCKHRPESAARSNHLLESSLGEGLRRQRDMHHLFFYIAGAPNKSWTYMWFMCLTKKPSGTLRECPMQMRTRGGAPQAPATARFPSGCPAPRPQRQPACRGASAESWAWTLWVYQVRDD